MPDSSEIGEVWGCVRRGSKSACPKHLNTNPLQGPGEVALQGPLQATLSAFASRAEAVRFGSVRI